MRSFFNDERIEIKKGNRMFLTTDEMENLIGTNRRKKQIAWLQDRKFPYEVDILGNPKVLKSFIECRLGDIRSKNNKMTEPDIEGFRRRNDEQKKTN
jgi:hypothetical protein